MQFTVQGDGGLFPGIRPPPYSLSLQTAAPPPHAAAFFLHSYIPFKSAVPVQLSVFFFLIVFKVFKIRVENLYHFAVSLSEKGHGFGRIP